MLLFLGSLALGAEPVLHQGVVLAWPDGRAVAVCPVRTADQMGWDTGASKVEADGPFLRVTCVDEDLSHAWVSFVRDGVLVDLAPLHTARKARFPHTACLWARAHGDRILAWDLERHGEPYSCANDSQADGGFTIPRHYLLDPRTGAVEVVEHASGCATLRSDGAEVVCVPPEAPPR